MIARTIAGRAVAMRQPGALFSVLVLAGGFAACDDFALFISPGPIPPAHSSPIAPRSIVVGEFVSATFVVPEIVFDLSARSTGNLLVIVRWDRRHGDIDLILGSSVFALPAAHRSIGDAALAGTLRVVDGQNYRLTVAGARGPVPFTLTTSIE